MANLGVRVFEKATAVPIPVVANVSIPFVVGLAPVQSAAKPAKANVPVLCTSWDEAVEKLGFSYDWERYTLCEFMHSHLRLFGAQPVIFCNILDPATMKHGAEARDYDVADHKIILPVEAMAGSIRVMAKLDEAGNTVELARDEDYSVFYERDDTDTYVCIVELLEDGIAHAYDAATLNVAYSEVDPKAAMVADIVDGVAHVDACMTMVGVIPDLICAPGWSHNPVVAAIMATKAAGINGLFRAKALIDCDSGENGVREYSELTPYKNKNNLVDENQILCWPQVKLGDYQFHMSTQLAGLMASVDSGNAGVPYESPSNKCFKMDCCCLEDGTEINLTWDQVNLVAGSYGVVTAINFMSMGWTAKGNYTACFPGNTDVKDQFVPVSRMFDFVGNTLIRTFWSKLDKPMNRRLIDTILDTCNIWLNGLVASEYLLGARAEMLESENTLTDLMAGILHIHIYITPPSPMQECDFTLEYDTSYVTAALQGYLEIYEDSQNLLGVAKVQLPEITYPCVTIFGSGMMGNMEVPLYGMVDAMTIGINFLTTTQDAVRLMAPKKHQLDLRIAEEYWNVEQAEVGLWADKYVVVARPKSIKPGNIAPMAAADTSGEFAVYYYAAYKDGRQLWEIDKRSMKCVIDGVDYMADVRKALGKQ